MTDEYIPRKVRKMKWEELTPMGARQKDIYEQMKRYLMLLGLDHDAAEKVALDLWRMTRRG